jgi:serine/threonine protein kinase
MVGQRDPSAAPCPVLREQYYMVRKLGGGGFGTVYMVQVGPRPGAISAQRKTNKELFAAKHQKHARPDELRYARNELEILTRMAESPRILALMEYFESGLQSVILTEYLEVQPYNVGAS